MATTALITCKTGCEKILSRELAVYGIRLEEKNRGWVLAKWDERPRTREHDTPLEDPCFAHTIFKSPVMIHSPSVNGMTDNLMDLFTRHIEHTRITAPWALHFSCCDDKKIPPRMKTIAKHWINKIQKKMSRVAKLSREGIPHSTRFTEGFFAHFISIDHAFVSFQALSAGQQRMRMDPKAPSRSYLKLEEAFTIFGHAPRANDTVVDLGAAPGGWSYSALKRGAIVTAVDNGPLKEPVRSHPSISHLKTDALKYKYHYPIPADWLLCDILERPEIILTLLHKWLEKKWCLYFIANIKVGRDDPILLLKKIRDPRTGLLPYCRHLYIRQAYHDREEITLMGQARNSRA